MAEGQNKNPNLWLIKTIHHWPTRILCIFIVIIQSASLDFYLVFHLGKDWYSIIAGDVISCFLFVTAMVLAQRNIVHEKRKGQTLSVEDSKPLQFSYIGWLCYAILLDVKIVVIFKKFAHDLKEHAFFGENTLKTSIALDGIVFMAFLASQHNALPGTPRRAFVQELTATVLFDVLDGVDSLEILLDKEAREGLYPGLENTIIAICCITFILPTVPLLTLSVTRFGLIDVGEKLVVFHRFVLGYMINLPLLIIRLILWHGMKEGVSIFALKNLIIMGAVTFELLEHLFNKRVQMSKQKREPDHSSTNDTRL